MKMGKVVKINGSEMLVHGGGMDDATLHHEALFLGGAIDFRVIDSFGSEGVISFKSIQELESAIGIMTEALNGAKHK